MKFQQYINEEYINVFGYAFLTNELNEVSDEFLVKLQHIGRKMGIKVIKSKTFQKQMKGAGKGVVELMKMVLDYSIHADIFDTQSRTKLEDDMKDQLSKCKREDVVSFIINIDKSFFGITSIPRHILQNVLGVTFTAFDNYENDVVYIGRSIKKIIPMLDAVGDEEDIDLAKRIYFNVTGQKI